MSQIIAGRYKISHGIAQGSYGSVFQALDQISGVKVAVKYEHFMERQRLPYGAVLKLEAKLYDILQGGVGVPNVYYHGMDKNSGHCVLVMDLLGPSLAQLYEQFNCKFSVKTVAMLGFQMLERLEHLHKTGWVHRDVKPHNFVIGNGPEKNMIFLIDFGMAVRYLDNNGRHIPWKINEDKKGGFGSMRYMSINMHSGGACSRRDDLESLGYVLMQFLRKLPWQGIAADEKDRGIRLEKVKGVKWETTVEELCQGFPEEFRKYMDYCVDMAFEQKPDYEYLKGLFRGLWEKRKWECDGVFDWSEGEDEHEVITIDSSDDDDDENGKNNLDLGQKENEEGKGTKKKRKAGSEIESPKRKDGETETRCGRVVKMPKRFED